MVAGLVDDRVDQYLRGCAAKVDQEIAAVLDAGVDDPWMRGAIDYHIGWADIDFVPLPPNGRERGGKRLRPALALLSFESAARRVAGGAVEPDIDKALAFAAAIELLHNYSLVHDDIEDRDHFRRGRPALWTVCGEAQAINVGDCLHDLAFGCLVRTRPRRAIAGRMLELVASFASAAAEMTVGQSRDLALESDSAVSAERYLQMIAGKTAAVTRCASHGGALLALGSASSGARRTLAAYADFGRELGLGFQIRDDYLGIWGAEPKTGKPTGSDIRRRKKGLPIVIAFQESSAAAQAELSRLYESAVELTSDEETYVRGLLDECGAAARTQDYVEVHLERALDALTAAAGGPSALRDDPALAILEQLAAMLTTRDH